MFKIIFLLAISLFSQTFFDSIPDTTWMKIPNSETYVGRDMLAYSQTEFDEVHGRIICYGGGHASRGFANHIMVYDLNTLSWSQLYEPDSCSEYSGTTNGIVDGKPWVAHTYDHFAYVSHLHKLFYIKGAAGGYMPACDLPYDFTYNEWYFDFSISQWSQVTTTGIHPEPPYYGGSITSVSMAYDPYSQYIFAARTGNTYRLDLDSLHWERLTTNGSSSSSIENYMTIAPDRGKLAQYGGSYSSNNILSIYNIDSNTWTQHIPNYNPGNRAMTGLTYDTRRSKVALYGGTNGDDDVWFYDFDLDEWESVLGYNYPTHNSGSFHYDSLNNVFVGVFRISTDGLEVWAFKLDGDSSSYTPQDTTEDDSCYSDTIYLTDTLLDSIYFTDTLFDSLFFTDTIIDTVVPEITDTLKFLRELFQ